MVTRIGRYEAQETLGKGGMGVVYRARDPELERDVAIKVVLAWAQYDEEAMARFDREAKVVAQLQHPHIITVFDAGRTAEGLPYFVMEYLEGTDLKTVIGRGPLPAVRALRYAVQVCEGLAYAHARDIVHRDIKPANLLITPHDEVKIVDFGIARVSDSRLTGTGVSMGTPLYMAPEQVSGKPVDQRADIFALGSVIYAMLSGRSPFDAPTLGAICNKIENEDPPSFAEQGIAAPAGLESIVRRALEKDPAQRPQSARQLADELRAVRAEAESLATAPTLITKKGGPAGSGGQPAPVQRSRGTSWWLVPAAAAVLFVALSAWPGSPLRRHRQPAATAPAPEQSADQEPAKELSFEQQPANAQPEAPTASGEGRVPAGQPGAATGAPAAQPPAPTAEADAGHPALRPATAEERAAVERMVAAFARAVESKDSAAVARIYGGNIPERDWQMVERMMTAPRLRLRPQLESVRRSDDGSLLATVTQEIRLSAAPRQAPRQTHWAMVFSPNSAGGMRLRSILPRQARNP